MIIRTFIVDYKDKNGRDMYRENYITGKQAETMNDLEVIEYLCSFYEDQGCEVMALTELFHGYHYSELLRMSHEGRHKEVVAHVKPFYIAQSAVDALLKDHGIKQRQGEYRA